MTSLAGSATGGPGTRARRVLLDATLFSLERSHVGIWDGVDPLGHFLPEVLHTNGVTAGDVVVSRLAPDCSLAAVESAFLAEEQVIRRTPAVTDAYRCGLADRLMAAINASPPHHTQLRRFELQGADVLQVAVYPCPPSAHGVRLWCDPALVWIFIGPADRAQDAFDGLVALQSSWERLRAHHGVPLDRPQPEGWLSRYPVVDPPQPLDDDERRRLCSAVEMLVGQRCVQALVNGDLTPREAVDRTLDARRDLEGHLDRLEKVLEHSHGRAETKYELLEETAGALLEATDADAREHLLAPHRHLVDGLDETRHQVAGAVAGAATTAALVSSAAVGRLLDRSEANRMATTAVAVAAFAIAVLTVFTALAAVPRVDRAVGDLTRLGSWLGAGSVVLVGIAWSLAKIAAIPADASPVRLRQWSATLTVAGGLSAAGVFVVGGLTGSLGFVVAAVAIVLLTAFFRAWTDDY